MSEERIEHVVKVNKKGEHVARWEVQSWGTTLEFTNSESQAKKSYDKSNSWNKKLYKVDTEGLKILVKTNYFK